MDPLTVGELKKLIEDVPDEYILTISLEGVSIVVVSVDHEDKAVDFGY